MTEQEWLAAKDPNVILDRLVAAGSKPSDRKLRLFATACVRMFWPMLDDARSKTAVEVAERFADSRATPKELAAARDAAWDAARDAARDAVWAATRDAAWDAARDAAWDAARDAARGAAWDAARDATRDAAWDAARDAAWAATRDAQCNLLRDMIAWRPVVVDAAWRTPQVMTLAQAAYEERNTDGTLDSFRLALAADALEEAGCSVATGARTRSEVIRQRGNAVMGGCCNLFADYQGCDCLETAAPDSILAHLRSPGPHVRGCHVIDSLLGKE